MELQIKRKIVEADMDLSTFKKAFKSDLSLYKALKSSTKITFNEGNINEDRVFMNIFSDTNWLFFLSNMKTSSKKTATFRFFLIDYKDAFRYKCQ